MVSVPIERLPPELLHPIFYFSGFDLALPASSPAIASKLSDGHVYRSVCTYHLSASITPSFEMSRAQTRIFACKWMTWDFFRSWIVQRYQGSGCLCGRTRTEGCFDPQWPPDFEDVTNMSFGKGHPNALASVKCRLPAKLLHGPWTKDKMQFLRFLLWTTAMNVDWSDPTVRSIALQGKKDAIMERNHDVVELFNHNRRLGKAPDLATVRFAVIDGQCDRSIVFDIMATARLWGLQGNSWRCAELDQWCQRRIEAGDPKGNWLQLKLQELRSTVPFLFRAQSPTTVDPNTSAVVEDEDLTASTSQATPGYMDPRTGDYDGGDDDRLVIRDQRWNQVSTVNLRIAIHNGISQNAQRRGTMRREVG